mmetsp:Transcript_573/g.1294  ORF Transcript_573/g.1294 Transcript_573/m.1294 type:complete len:389 (-) Transcript_573:1104-2270(-)
MRQLKKRSLCGSLASSEASYRSCRDVCCEAATSMQLAQGVAVSAGGHVPPTGARAAPTRSAGTDPDPDEEPLCPLAAGPGERLRSAGWGCRCSLCLAGRQLPGPRLLQPGRSSPELPSRRHGPHRARVPRRSRWGPLSGSQKGYVDAKVTSDFSILPWRLRWARVEAAGAPYLRLPCRSRSNCAALQTSPSPATLMLLSRMKDVIASEQRARETPSTYGARKTEASSSTNRMALKQKSPSNCSCTSRVCARPRQCLGMKCVWRTTLAMASSGSKTGVPSPITARLTASSTPRQAPHQTRLCPAKCRSIRTSFTDARKMTSAAKLPLTKATNRAICWAMGVGNCEMYSTAASRLAARRCSRRCSTSLNSLRHHLAYGDQLRAATELGWW